MSVETQLPPSRNGGYLDIWKKHRHLTCGYIFFLYSKIYPKTSDFSKITLLKHSELSVSDFKYLNKNNWLGNRIYFRERKGWFLDILWGIEKSTCHMSWPCGKGYRFLKTIKVFVKWSLKTPVPDLRINLQFGREKTHPLSSFFLFFFCFINFFAS